MKKILVLGATGRIGQELLTQGAERGHRMTAFVRSPEKLAAFADRARIVRGNPLDSAALGEAVDGEDAIVSALGPPGIGPSTVQEDVARATIAAMRARGSRRLLTVSAALLFRDAGLLAAFLRTTFLRNVTLDCTRAEALITPSDLDWTIVRPPRLIDTPRTNAYRTAVGRMPEGARGTMCRADVAHFLLEEVERGAHVRQIVGAAATR